LNIESATNIVFDPASALLNPASGAGGTGGNLSLNAGNGKGQSGTVKVLAGLNMDGDGASGFGGSVQIISNSSTPFVVTGGSTMPANGVFGPVTANGGQGAISLINKKGALTVDNVLTVTGNALLGTPGAITLTAGAGNLTVTAAGGSAGSLIADGVAGTLLPGAGGTIALEASKGVISVAGSISASSAATSGVFGGSITITEKSSAPFQVGGQSVGKPGTQGGIFATGSSKGGSVTIVAGSTSPFNVGQILTAVNGTTGSITATGGIGGSISITNLLGGVKVPVPTSDLLVTSSSGAGGSIYVEGKGDVAIAGTLSADSGGNFPGGSVTIVSNSAKPFNVGDFSAPNCVGAIDASGSSGGTINIINKGTGGIIVAAGGQHLFVNATAGKGGTLKLTASAGPLVLNGSSALLADATNGDGGNIHLLAKSYTVLSGPFTMSALDSDFASGGNISIFGTAAGKSLAVDSTTFTITTHGGANGGSGGNVTVSSGGNLTVDPNQIIAAPGDPLGNGPNLVLIAGSSGPGNLNITSALNVTSPGGPGGTIALFVNSSTPFNIGSPAAINPNGVVGGLTAMGASGGRIGVKNSGTGGIVVSSNTAISANATDTLGSPLGGAVDLEAPKGKLSFAFASGLFAPTNGNISSGGTITLLAKTITSAGNLQISADAGTGAPGGSIYITQTSTTVPLTLGNAAGQIDYSAQADPLAARGNVFINSSSKIVIAGAVGHTNENTTLGLPAAGSGTIATTGGGIISAFVLSLNVGKGNIGSPQNTTPANAGQSIGSNNFQMDVNTVNVNSQGGNVFLFNIDAAPLTVGTAFQKSIPGKSAFITIGSFADIAVSGRMLAASATQTISLVAGSNGSITLADDVVAGTVNLLADDSTGSTAAVTQSAGLIGLSNCRLNITTGSNGVSLSDTDASTISISGIAGSGAPLLLFNNGTIKNLAIASNTFGNIEIGAFGSINGPSTALQASGTITFVTSPLSNGSVLINSPITAGVAAVFDLGGFGSLVQSAPANFVTAGSIILTSGAGNLATNATPLQLAISGSGGALSANTSGSGTVNLNVSSSTGNNYTIESSASGGNFIINSTGGFSTAGNISALHGSLKLVAGNNAGNNINIGMAGQPTTLFSGAGSLTVENDNTTDGTILIEAGSAAIANGQINVVIGSVPTGQTPGTAPPNTTVNTAGSFAVRFGSTGIADNAPQNVINALGNDVVFDVKTLPASAITLNGGVTLTARNTPTIVSSLDLTDKNAVAQIVTLGQSAGSGVTNRLVISAGIATGGVLTIENSVNVANMSGLNIPANVTVNFVGFDEGSPVGVQVSGPALTTKNPAIKGIVNFVQESISPAITTPILSNAYLSVTSTVPCVILSIAKSGVLGSDASLALNAGGDVSIAGTFSGPGDVALNATAGNNFKANTATPGTLSGAISLSGSVTGGPATGFGSLTFTSTAGIFQTACFVSSRVISFNINGSNAITQKGLLSADTVNINYGDQLVSFGTAKNGFFSPNVNMSSLNVPGASMTLTDGSAVVIGNFGGTIGGALSITDPSGITVPSFLQAGSYNIKTPNLTVNGNMLTDNPAGTIAIKSSLANTPLVVAGSGTMQADAGIIISNIGAKGTIYLANVTAETAAGAIVVSAAAAVTADATLTAGEVAPSYAGGLLGFSDVVSAGSITIKSTGSVTLTGFDPLVGGGPAAYTATGGDINVLSTAGDITSLMNPVTMSSNGGNIYVLSAKNVNIDGLTATASAVGTVGTNAVGGRVELGAGTSKPAVVAQYNVAPDTRPLSSLGLNTNVTTTDGAILTIITGTGLININFSNITPAGGLLVFDAKNRALNVTSSSLNTNAFLPIGFRVSECDELEEIIVDSGDDQAAL
jgi:hypothetical protein